MIKKGKFQLKAAINSPKYTGILIFRYQSFHFHAQWQKIKKQVSNTQKKNNNNKINRIVIITRPLLHTP